MEVGVSAGSAALAIDSRKHKANDPKCKELGWLCVSLVAETYGAWGNEAIEAFYITACHSNMQAQVDHPWRLL